MIKHLLIIIISIFVLPLSAVAWPNIDVGTLGGGKAGAAPSAANYFGNGSDGVLSTTGNVNYIANIDGDIIVKNYDTLTINAGHTVTTNNRCKGLLILVQGDCTINGTLTMTARGAYVTPIAAGVPEGGLQFGMLKSSGSANLSGATVSGTGAACIAAMAQQPAVISGVTFWVKREGAVGYQGPGPAGDGHQSGAGGCGGSKFTPFGGGSGGTGTCFSGGTGGGGGLVSAEPGDDGDDYGGPGGNGIYENYGGGAGNPLGAGGTGGSNGTGGLLMLIVGGNLTIGASAVISADGSNGANALSEASGGGGSGGGNIIIAYAGTLSNAGTVQATAGTGGGSVTSDGRNGGAGSIQGPTKVNPR